MAKVTKPTAPAVNENDAPIVNDAPVTAPPAAVAKPEPTSDKLTELKAKKSETIKQATVETDEAKQEDLFLEVYKINEQIKQEIAAIKKHEGELAKKEKEAAIVKMFDDAVEAAILSRQQGNDDSLTLEQKQVSYDAMKASREVIVNRLLGTVKAAPATSTGGGDKPAGTRGATTTAIRALIHDMYVGATVDNVAEIGAAARKLAIGENGFNDGTANQVILNYEKELGLK